MARSSKFWSWHASVNDSVRHELIEKGWFGRETTPNINQQDMPALGQGQGASAPQHHDLYGHSPQPSAGIHGSAASTIQAPKIEPPAPKNEQEQEQ